METYINTVGLDIYFETGIALAGATSVVIHIKKPRGKWFEWTGPLISGTQFVYTTVSGDLNEDGWHIAYIALTLGGFTGFSEPGRFLVKDPTKPDRKYGI